MAMKKIQESQFENADEAFDGAEDAAIQRADLLLIEKPADIDFQKPFNHPNGLMLVRLSRDILDQVFADDGQALSHQDDCGEQEDKGHHNMELNVAAAHQLIHQFAQNHGRAVGQDSGDEHQQRGNQ